MKSNIYLICSLTADSHWSQYFWRASERCGEVGTRSSSLLTSSKGSNTTPLNCRLLDPFDAQTTRNRSFPPRGNRTVEGLAEQGKNGEGTGERRRNRAPSSPFLKRDRARVAWSDIGSRTNSGRRLYRKKTIEMDMERERERR